MDWTGGLTFFVLKVIFVLSCETSLSCRFRHDGILVFINLDTLFSLFKHEVNNSSATTVVKPCFTLCLVCSMV